MTGEGGGLKPFKELVFKDLGNSGDEKFDATTSIGGVKANYVDETVSGFVGETSNCVAFGDLGSELRRRGVQGSGGLCDPGGDLSLLGRLQAVARGGSKGDAGNRIVRGDRQSGSGDRGRGAEVRRADDPDTHRLGDPAAEMVDEPRVLALDR